ncbi:MAG: DUF1697 domain-containing protein [Moraxellaceae bacterium]|nr:DUF1697 domain-containing protein [Moraxellaceae bacterium]
MTRYVAFLRGVSPMNCRMPELRRCFEQAGFEDVKTLLSSGNVAFSAEPDIVPVLEKQAEEAMQQYLGRTFHTIVRPSRHLQSLIASDPFAAFALPENAKRILVLLKQPFEGRLDLPIKRTGAALLQVEHSEAFAFYVPDEADPGFMNVLERSLGKAMTTRTLGTVGKCAAA